MSNDGYWVAIRKISNLSDVVGSDECISSVLSQNVKDSSLNDLDCQLKYYKKYSWKCFYFLMTSYDQKVLFLGTVINYGLPICQTWVVDCDQELQSIFSFIPIQLNIKAAKNNY